MPDSPKLTFYHSPFTRSAGVFVLLEELGVPYDLHVLNMKTGEQRQPTYLAVNPMGKVPAITHGDALVTEQVAIFIYLADFFSEKNLAPALTDPSRGPYLRWMAFYGACFEPAVMDKAMSRDSGKQSQSGYGDYDSVIKTITDQLSKGPYLLGDKISAADILWGTALGWTTRFKMVPEHPAIMDYVNRIGARPAAARVKEKDAKLAAAQAAKA